MYGNTGITEHCLGTSGGYLNAFSGALNFVAEMCNDTKLNFLVV
jgi:hypothetical protein